jgi:replication factor A1
MAGIATDVKVRDLSPQSKSVNLTVKVVSVGKPQSVASKSGGTRTVTEVIVGDDTGTVVMSLWDRQAEGVQDGQVLRVDNGYVSLVKGHVHLNVGRYGRIISGQGTVASVDTEHNVSEADHATEHPRDRDLGGAVDLRFRRGPPASTGYGLEDDARARGLMRRRRGRSDRDRGRYY